MVLTHEELQDRNMEALNNYLTERGVTSSGGGSRKADLIRKVLAADGGERRNYRLDKRGTSGHGPEN